MSRNRKNNKPPKPVARKNLHPLRKWLVYARMNWDLVVLGSPFLSTILFALILASFWLAMWIIVLFVATYHTIGLEDNISSETFITALILSTVAEAGIRIGEQSRLSERYTLGDLRLTNTSFTFWKAFTIFLLGMWGVANLEAFGPLPSLEEFALHGPSGTPGDMKEMIIQWHGEFEKSQAMTNWLIFCALLRVWVYKRNHRTNDWKHTAKHIKKRRRLLKNYKTTTDKPWLK